MCEEHTKQTNTERNNKDKDKIKFYNSPRWKQIREQMRIEEPFCRVCKRAAEMVDHIIPLTSGGAAYERENLQRLCHQCHNKKRSDEAKTFQY